jgi:hypothetical protein
VLETLRKGGEFILYRGRQRGNPFPVLVLAPIAEQPTPASLKRLEHEYSQRVLAIDGVLLGPAEAAPSAPDAGERKQRAVFGQGEPRPSFPAGRRVRRVGRLAE